MLTIDTEAFMQYLIEKATLTKAQALGILLLLMAYQMEA